MLKALLEQKLNGTSTSFGKAASQEEKDALREEAYWLTQAIENENPDDTLKRAFSFWQTSNGKTGLKPFELPAETPKKIPPPPAEAGGLPLEKGENAPPAMLTLWGMLDRAFQNGEHLDDRHVSHIFNHLPPASQTHFIDTVTNHIRSAIKKTAYTSSDIAPILKDEALLSSLVEKTKLTATSKEDDIQQIARKLTDWLKYHEAEPTTEEKLEEVLYGIDAAKAYMKKDVEEDQKLHQHIMEGGALNPQQEETIRGALPRYELLIRDRLRMTTAEYLRIRHVSLEKLLSAVPTDPKKLALITQSAIRQDLLTVPDAEFQKRVRAASLIRAYSFTKELYPASIRQFFRSVVEE